MVHRNSAGNGAIFARNNLLKAFENFARFPVEGCVMERFFVVNSTRFFV